MNPISASELTSIQTDMAALLDLPCLVERKTTTPDPVGSGSFTWRTIYTAWSINNPTGLLAGMAQPNGGQLANYGYLIGSLASWQIKFPVGLTILPQDRLTINGQELTVQIILQPRSYQALLTVLATEIKKS